MKVGSDENGQLTLIDVLSIVSLLIGVENLDQNLDQNDKQDIQRELSERADGILAEIHRHLTAQDEKIDRILSILEKEVTGDEDNRETIQHD